MLKAEKREKLKDKKLKMIVDGRGLKTQLLHLKTKYDSRIKRAKKSRHKRGYRM